METQKLKAQTRTKTEKQKCSRSIFTCFHLQLAGHSLNPAVCESCSLVKTNKHFTQKVMHIRNCGPPQSRRIVKRQISCSKGCFHACWCGTASVTKLHGFYNTYNTWFSLEPKCLGQRSTLLIAILAKRHVSMTTCMKKRAEKHSDRETTPC